MMNVDLSEPVIVSQASPEVTNWGPWQFPRIERLADGNLHVEFHIEADSPTAYGLPMGHAVSRDQGRSWEERQTICESEGVLLPNGDRLMALQIPSIPVAELTLPDPVSTIRGSYADYTFYPVKDLPDELTKAFPFRRLPAGGSKGVVEWARVQMPDDVRIAFDHVFTFPFFEQDRIKVLPDGGLYATLYLTPQLFRDRWVLRICHTLFLRSDDAGRSWKVLSDIPYLPDPDADPAWDARDGFTEPEFAATPDGSLLCLLRTTDGHGVGPLYMVRSVDGGTTWTRPKVFDHLGVWPQLLSLGSGVTLCAYGRPGLYLRATADPSGVEGWDERLTLVAPGRIQSDTCSYSDLLPLDDRTAVIVYSDFSYPNPQGRPCKTILCRKISVQV